jgi:oligopeptide transport system ATP-binding protein
VSGAVDHSSPLLEVRNLETSFSSDDGTVQAVRGISFEVARGETVGIVGESGSGKSVANLSMLGLIPQPPGRVRADAIRFDGEDLARLSQGELRRIRGRRISMIFQDPMTSLNPFLRVSTQLTEVLSTHLGMQGEAAAARAIEMLDAVGIPGARRRYRSYPHEFSGGMRQRVMIAMALLCDPQLLIADEPTTALDVTIQAQILDLIREITASRGTAVILITHDLGVVAGMCQRVLVMYAGRIVESAPVDDLYARPMHPYTHGLISSLPRLDEESKSELRPIRGAPPNLAALPRGCPFAPRCPHVVDRCRQEEPPLAPVAGESERHTACWVAHENGGAW